MGEASNMATAVKSMFSLLIGEGGAIPTFFTWLTSAEVLEYAILGIACSLILFGVKVVRGTIWGL